MTCLVSVFSLQSFLPPGDWRSGNDIQDRFQAQRAKVFEIAAHGEAAPVDTWCDFAKVDHGARGRRRGSAILDAEGAFAFLH